MSSDNNSNNNVPLHIDTIKHLIGELYLDSYIQLAKYKSALSEANKNIIDDTNSPNVLISSLQDQITQLIKENRILKDQLNKDNSTP
jgi:hypothetical protein